MALDPLQTGSIVAAVSSLVGNVALYFDKKRTDRATLAAIQAQPAPLLAQPQAIAYDRELEKLRVDLRAELAHALAEAKAEQGRVADQARAEASAAKFEVMQLRTDQAKLMGENAALRLLLAEVNGDLKTLKVRVDQNVTEIAGVLSREHTEATARGKLMSRVEYMIGTLEGRSSSGE